MLNNNIKQLLIGAILFYFTKSEYISCMMESEVGNETHNSQDALLNAKRIVLHT